MKISIRDYRTSAIKDGMHDLRELELASEPIMCVVLIVCDFPRISEMIAI